MFFWKRNQAFVFKSIELHENQIPKSFLGKIQIHAESAKQYNLDKKRQNKILLKDSKLRKHGVKSILVECPDDRHSRDKKVRVSIEMLDGKRIANRTLSPGKTLRLSQGSLGRGSGEDKKRYILAKDPNASMF